MPKDSLPEDSLPAAGQLTQRLHLFRYADAGGIAPAHFYKAHILRPPVEVGEGAGLARNPRRHFPRLPLGVDNGQ